MTKWRNWLWATGIAAGLWWVFGVAIYNTYWVEWSTQARAIYWIVSAFVPFLAFLGLSFRFVIGGTRMYRTLTVARLSAVVKAVVLTLFGAIVTVFVPEVLQAVLSKTP